MIKLFNRSAKHRQSETVSLEKDDPEWLKRLTGAAREEPWHFTILKLAWTAGPATFAAASLGYYLGFGEVAPIENLRFFFYYTVVSGVVGLIASIIARATYGERHRMAKRSLEQVVDLLPDLIAAVRDLHLETLEPEVRRLEAAGLQLQRVDLDPKALALTVEDLGAGQELAQTAAKIELYRLGGIQTRVQELVESARAPAQRVYQALSEWTPQVGQLFWDRLNGHAPSFNDGIPRDSHFLERILASMEQEDDRLMTLLDAEELLVLAFELIQGRRIPMLVFSYRGRWALVQATEQLERRRNLYRIANAKVLSRLKALVALLSESDEIEVKSATRGTHVPTLVDSAKSGMLALNQAIYLLAARSPYLGGEHTVRLRRAVATLQEALRLYDSMQRASKEAGRRHSVFLQSIEKWEQAIKHHGNLEVTAPSRRRGLQLAERRIALNAGQRLELAQAISALFKTYGIHSHSDRIFYRINGHDRQIASDMVKSLTMEVASALPPLVDISRPDIQRAIDSSNASNLLGLEPAMSAQTKASRSAAAAAEVDDHLGFAAERLAATLVSLYRVELSDTAKAFLHQRYGARLDRLQMLSSSVPSLSPVSSLQTRPPLLLPAGNSWQRGLERSRRLLKRYAHLIER